MCPGKPVRHSKVRLGICFLTSTIAVANLGNKSLLLPKVKTRCFYSRPPIDRKNVRTKKPISKIMTLLYSNLLINDIDKLTDCRLFCVCIVVIDRLAKWPILHIELRRKIEEHAKETRRRDGKFLSMEFTCPNVNIQRENEKSQRGESPKPLLRDPRVLRDEIARTKFHRVNRNLTKDA